MFRNVYKIWIRNILLLVVGSDELIAGSLSQSMPIDEMRKKCRLNTVVNFILY